MKFIKRFCSATVKGMDWLCGSMLIVMTILAFIGVLARYVFVVSIPWIDEVTRYLMIWMTFLASAISVSDSSHTSVDILPSFLHKKLKKFDYYIVLDVLILVGMPVLPVALAIAEHLGIGDRRMLNAYIRGVEVSALIGAGFKNSTLSLCWNPTTISGGFGAVAAAAYLLDLTITQTTAAFAMMTCEIGGTKGNYGTPAKDVSAGILCAKAIICAQLAKEGITANPAAFSCSTGIAAAIAPDYDYEAVESVLKAKNSIFISPGLIPKPYPCCRSNHNAIDGTLKICKEHQITEDMVDSIICRIDPPSWTLDAYHCPDTPEQGKFSTAYCVAIALLHRRVVLDDFSGSEILEKRVFPLIARTKVVRDDTFQNAHFGNEITLKLKDGKTYTYRGTHAKGEACNPMTEEELRDKFLCCGERYYTKNSVQALFDSLSPGVRIPSVFGMNETLIDIQ